MSFRRSLFFLSAVSLCQPAAAAEFETMRFEAETGVLGSSTRSQFYLIPRLHANWNADEGASVISTEFSFRASTDSVNADRLEIRSLFAKWDHDGGSLTLGFQEIAWGETFGVFPLDIVNPRNFSDPLFNEMSWIRLPVASVQYQRFFGNLSIQGVLTPNSRSIEIPEAPQRAITEYGGKIGLLVEGGLDLNAIFFSHLNRFPVLNRDPGSGLTVLNEERVNSTGFSLSLPVDRFVLRADTLMSFNQPYTDSLADPVERGHWIQSVAGADVTTDSLWSFGTQAHLSRMEEALTWVSFRVQKPLFGDLISVEALVFQGVNNRDTWFQPQLTWRPLPELSLRARADLLFNSIGPEKQTGLLEDMMGRDRFLLWTTYQLR